MFDIPNPFNAKGGTMPILESTVALQDQVLDVIKSGEEAILSAVKTFAETVEPVTSNLSANLPFADQLPPAADAIDLWFGFAEKLLANQKAFILQLTGALVPTAAPAKATPADKSPKAA